MTAAAAIDFDMPAEERTTLLYQAGYLDWKLRDYQLADHEAFCAWDAERQTQEHLDEAAAAGALYDNMWVDECGRRYGKTAQWLIRDVNAAIRRPGARGLIACAYQKNIGEIIVPLTKVLFRDAPEGYFPEYRGTHGADHECLIIPATDSIIKLVGVDVHPKAVRGQWCDFCHLSEAAFIRNLRELVTSDIMPMFQDRPWAWIALESSTAHTRDNEFNTEFREDAKKRGTYRKHTIRDNTHLTEADIAKEERRSGGKGSANCQRELYCEEAREEALMVVPEFDVARHVKPANGNAMPAHAHCYVAMDPGEKDPLGLIWGFYDFARAKLVIQRSFAKSNCRTGEAAGIIKQVENELWGTEHRGIPETPKRDNAVRARPMLTIADAVRTAGGLVWEAPAAALTYWDHGENQFVPNPYRRISDIDARMVGDLAVEHSINFEKTAKDDQYAQESALRHAFAMDWIEIWEPDGDLARQLESGMWQLDTHGRRRDWMTTPSLGHLDCMIGSTLVKTEHGDVPISQIKTGTRVWTRAGLRVVTAAWCAGIRETWEAETTHGTIAGTADHKIYTTNGWKHLSALNSSDMLCGWESSDHASRCSSTATRTAVTPRRSRGTTEFITPAARGSRTTTFTKLCGGSIEVKSPTGWLCTTETRTPTTTTSPTSSLCLEGSTADFISRSRSALAPSDRSLTSAPASSASSASLRTSPEPYAAAHDATPRSGVALGKMTSRQSVVDATESSFATSIQGPRLAPVGVLRSRATGKTEAVYDITVEGEHEFFANGVLVHNCVAALIYLWRNLQREKNPHPPARIDTSLHGYALPMGVDINTATGRPANNAETQFRNSPTVRKWR